MTNNAILEERITDLYFKNAFLGHLIQKLQRIYDYEEAKKWKVYSAAVVVRNNNYILIVNPMYFEALLPEEQRAVLIHELYHILNMHIVRGQSLITEKGMASKKLLNISMDLAINQQIDDLPKYSRALIDAFIKYHEDTDPEFKDKKKQDMIDDMTKKIGQHSGVDLQNMNCPADKTMEFYYEYLRKRQEENPNQKLGGEKGSGHIFLNDDTIIDPDLLEEKTKAITKDAADKAAGSMSGYEKSLVEALATEKGINWKSLFRRWINHATRIIKKRSLKRPNRRFRFAWIKGIQTDYELTVGYCIDTSGSMSDEQLGEIIGEMNRIYDAGYGGKVIEFDAKITDEYDYNKRIKNKEFKGRGGTNANPALEKMNKQDVDMIVVFTDGELFEEPVKVDKPLLWVIFNNPNNSWVHEKLKNSGTKIWYTPQK